MADLQLSGISQASISYKYFVISMMVKSFNR